MNLSWWRCGGQAPRPTKSYKCMGCTNSNSTIDSILYLYESIQIQTYKVQSRIWIFGKEPGFRRCHRQRTTAGDLISNRFVFVIFRQRSSS